MKKGGAASFLVIALSVFLLLLTSCGGGSKPPTPAQFTVSLNPNAVTLPAGGTAQTTLTLKSAGGFSGTIRLEILRSDGTNALEFTLTPNQVDLAANQQLNVLLTISAAITVSSGSYSLTVRASAANLVRDASLSVTVPPPQQVNLPPIISGQGFPQPPLQVGSVSEGASLFAADGLTRIVISPTSLVLQPGESRDIAVWVEDESGNRYAGDSSFLQLKVAGPPGYQVQWAGPATLHIQAPSTYTSEPAFINVTRPSFAPGVAFLNAIGTATMVQYKPEVVVIPEERIGFPVAYELDEQTVQARFAPFWAVLSAALDLDSSDGEISIPALVRDDPNQPIQEGMWIVGEGEAAVLAGRVKRIVAHSNDVLLLAIDPAMPWDIYSEYQSELDFRSLIQQGIFPLDPSRISLGEIQVQTSLQGYFPMSLSGDKCKFETPKFGRQLDLGQFSNIQLDQLWLEASVEVTYKCDWGNWGAGFTLTEQLGIGRFIFTGERIKAESSFAVQGELKVFIEMPVEVVREGEVQIWLANFLIPIPIPIPAVDVYIEVGLTPTNFSSIVDEEFNPPQEIEVFKAGIRGGFGANLVIDSAQTIPVDVSFSPDLSLFAESPLLGLSTSPGDWSWTVKGDLVGIGVGLVVGVGGKALWFLEKLLKLMGQHLETDKTVLGLSATISLIPPIEWRYVTMKRALTQGVNGNTEEPGHFAFALRSDLLVQLRGAVAAAIRNGLRLENLGPFAQIVGGIKATLRELPGEIRPNPIGNLVIERLQDSIKVSGRFVLGGARATEVRAYRLSDIDPYNSTLQPIAVATPTNDTFVLHLPIPTNCGSAPIEENTAAIAVWFGLWGNGPQLPLGWTYLGKVDLCAPVQLAVPAIRGFVGSQATGVGGLRYLGTEPETFTLRANEFSISPDALEFNNPGRKDFNISYTCEEQGSFVDRIIVGTVSAPFGTEAPAIVSCIPDGDRNSNNNPTPDRSSRRTLSFFGDPHLITPDGAAYDFHAAGEFWAVEHPNLSFQLRFKRMPDNPDATYISRLGAKLGSAIVEVFPTVSWQYENDFLPEVTLTVLVNGQDLTEELKEPGFLALPNDTYIAVHRWANVFVNGILVDRRPLELALIYGGTNPRPAVLVQADRIGSVSVLGVGAVRPGSLAGQLKGLMGNANGNPEDDFVTRNGETLTPPLGFGTLYQVFGRSWEVTSGERYFTDPAPQFSYPGGPPGLNPENRTQCEAYCSAIQDPYLREACILDGVVSGDCAGAANLMDDLEEDRAADGQGSPQNSTRTAILGIGPSYIHLIRGGEATLVVAHPYSEGSPVTYRLRVVGEGPGIRVDGITLTDNQTSTAYSLQPTESRSHTLAPECDQEDHVYLIQAVEEEATEARSAAILVSCNLGFNLSMNPSDFQLYAPGGAAFQTTLSPYGGFTGEVTLSVTDENGNPMPEFTVTPDRIQITGATEVIRTATLRVSSSAGAGQYSLKLRASSWGNITSEVPFTASITRSDEGTQWTLRVHRNVFVEFLNGNFVLYSQYNNKVLISRDGGVTYEGHDLGFPFQIVLNKITYGNETYVAVGKYGFILASADLHYWVRADSGTTAHLYSVTFGAGIFVAVGASGTILTSPDGINWMSRSSPVNEDISVVTYGNNMFVAWTGAHFLTSFDGITWEAYTKTVRPDYPLDIAYGAGRFMVVGTAWNERGYVAVSEDGLNWRQIMQHYYAIEGVTYGDGSFFILTEGGNLLRWDEQNGWRLITNTDRPGEDLAYGNGRLLVSTFYNLRIVDFDAAQNAVITTLQPQLSDNCWLHEVAFTNGVFVAGANGPTSYTSADGALWEGPTSISDCNSSNGEAEGIAGDENGRFVMVLDKGAIYTSQDGINWQLKKPSDGHDYLYSVAYGNGQFIAVGTKILVSNDGGDNWTEVFTPSVCFPLNDVAYGNGMWVAVGGRCIYTSSDGTTWNEQTLPSSAPPLTAVAYGNGLFVAVGNDGAIYTSADGTEWTRRNFRTTSADFSDIAFGNGTFIITKYSGVYSEYKGFIVLSHDGIVWTEIEHPLFKNINSLAYGNGRWVAVGTLAFDIYILTSP